MDPAVIQAQNLPRIMVSCKKMKKKTLKNSINEKITPYGGSIQPILISRLIPPCSSLPPSPGAYLAGKSQTIREAVPANFLQGTCNFLMGLSSRWLTTASQKKVRATVFPRTGPTFYLLSEAALRVTNLTHWVWTKVVKWRRA